MNDQNNMANTSDELTLKELILTIQEYVKEVFKKWWVVVLITALFVGYFLYKHYTHVKTYPASMEFMAQSGGSNPVGGILGQFGLGSQQGLSPFKVLEVASSGRILNNVLSAKSEGKLIANELIGTYKLDEQWSQRNPDFKNFRFKTDSLLISTSLDKSAFKRISGLVWKGNGTGTDAMMSIDYDTDTGIYTLSSNGQTSWISSNLLELTYKEVKNFFEYEIVANKVQAIRILDSKMDSLRTLRETKNYQIAAFEDRNRNVFSKTATAQRNILQQDFLAISGSLSEVMRNKELADFNMRNNAALFIEVDRTLEPLSPTRSSIVRKLLSGISFGLFISIFLIVVRKLYREILK